MMLRGLIFVEFFLSGLVIKVNFELVYKIAGMRDNDNNHNSENSSNNNDNNNGNNRYNNNGNNDDNNSDYNHSNDYDNNNDNDNSNDHDNDDEDDDDNDEDNSRSGKFERKQKSRFNLGCSSCKCNIVVFSLQLLPSDENVYDKV